MIRNCGGRTIAHLANDSICSWNLDAVTLNTLSKVVPTIICDSVLIAVTCRVTNKYAMLTQNGRVLVGVGSSNYIEDITDLIPLASRGELKGCDTEIFLDARTRVSFGTLAIKTQTSISFVYVGIQMEDKAKGIHVKYIGTEIYPSGINMFGVDSWRAVVRTNSNSLYSIKIGYEGITSSEIHHPEVENIQQLVCANSHIFILKQDGIVCERSINGSMPGQVDVFNEESVSKIITGGPHVFFITVGGMCYYLNYDIHGYRHPRLIGALEGYHVESLFVLRDRVIFQHDGNRLCFLHLAYYEDYRFYSGRIDSQHIVNSTTPHPLPFCEDMSIVSAENIGQHIIFITDEGRAYSALALNLESQPLVEIPFFADRPLMIRNRVTAIKSAASDPRDT